MLISEIAFESIKKLLKVGYEPEIDSPKKIMKKDVLSCNRFTGRVCKNCIMKKYPFAAHDSKQFSMSNAT